MCSQECILQIDRNVLCLCVDVRIPTVCKASDSYQLNVVKVRITRVEVFKNPFPDAMKDEVKVEKKVSQDGCRDLIASKGIPGFAQAPS